MATLQVCPHPQNIYVIASCSLLNSRTGSPSLKVLLPMAMHFNLRKEVHSVHIATISLQPHGIFTNLHEN